MSKGKSGIAMPSGDQAGSPDGDNDWQAEGDLHTLMQAHKIKADKKRHGKAKAMAKRKMAAIAAVKNGE